MSEIIRASYLSQYRAPTHRQPGTAYIMREGEDLPVLCTGISAELKKGTPLRILAEFNGNAINAVDYCFDTTRRETVIAFFAGRAFPGCGEKAAGKLIDLLSDEVTGKDISWAQLPDEKVAELIAASEARLKAHLPLLHAITGIQRRKEIRDKYMTEGASLKDIETIYAVYGGCPDEKLRKDPYTGLTSGLSFTFCDNAAYNAGIDIFDTKRMLGLIKALIDRISSSGSCCMRIKEAVDILMTLQKKSKYRNLTRALMTALILSSNKLIIRDLEDYGPVVYPKYLYRAEQNIAKEIKRLFTNREETGFEMPTEQGSLDEAQFAALRFLKQSGVYTVTGGPGAGKTTVIRRFIEEYERLYPERAVRLCAPTGRAAARITESCGGKWKAVTIHKMLGIRPGEAGSSSEYNSENRLPSGLYIIDEMSMTDELLFLSLLEAMPDNAILILSGDRNQLPSVQAGTVLKDVIASGVIDTQVLPYNHRQGAGSLIVENYHQLLNLSSDLKEGPDFEIVRCSTEQEALNAVGNFYCLYTSDDPAKFQILTAVKKGTLGKENLNRLISESRMKTKNPSDIYGSTGFSVGDKIMMTANNYDKGYWNGDVGVITGIVNGDLRALFYDGERTIDRESLEDMELAYASTIHKAQGSEYDVAVIVLDIQFKNMLYNSLFLTAITRARKKVCIVATGEAVKIASETDREAERITGLKETIRDIF